MADRGVRRGKSFVVLRLWASGAANWGTINAECILAGVNLRKMHPHDFTQLVYYMITRHMDSKEQQKYERDLWRPPHGEIPEDDNPVWGPDAELADFDRSSGGRGVDRQ